MGTRSRRPKWMVGRFIIVFFFFFNKEGNGYMYDIHSTSAEFAGRVLLECRDGCSETKANVSAILAISET